MRAPILAAVLALLAAGCANDFHPPSLLDDLRVLALVADRPEIGFAESTTVSAYTWPGVQAAKGVWTFCPFSLGSSVGYDCIAPQCEQRLTPSGPAVQVAPAANPCVQAVLGGAAPGGVPVTLPARVDTVVRYVVTDAAGVVTREAVLRLPVTYPDPPASPNGNPVIQRVEIGGAEVWPAPGSPPPLLGGGKLTVHVVLARPEVTPAGIPEDSIISFFTTAGRFDYDRAIGPDGSAKLEGKELAGATSPAEIWIVARDLRGGQAVQGPFYVELSP